MPADANTLLRDIREVISEIGEIDEVDSIQPDHHFIEDLDLDSMMLLEILSTLERNYQISIPEEEFPNMTTLTLCVETVQKRLAA
jgi:acyl carrier protein